ncbi:MAG: ParB/RepB/Spo0J family partition protein [Nitrososphaerota archaeon]
MKTLESRKIRLNQIKIPEWARRIVIIDHELEDLAGSIKQMGQIEPIIVRKIGDEGYELISGYRRFMALENIGASEAEAKIVECSDGEAIALSIEENLKRSDEHPFDTARKIAYMHRELGLSVRKIGELIGRDDSWVGMMLSIDSIDPEAKKILAPKVKDNHIIYYVATLDDPRDQRALAEAIIRYNLRRKDVEDIKKEAKEKGLSIREVLTMVSTPDEYKPYSEAQKSMASNVSEAREELRGHKTLMASEHDGLEEARECDLCGEKIGRSQGRFYFICRSKHSSLREIFKLARKHGCEKIEEALDYLIIEVEDLVQRPREEMADTLKLRRMIAENTRGLDIYALDQLLREVKKHEV